jgi:hypothetical protein
VGFFFGLNWPSVFRALAGMRLSHKNTVRGRATADDGWECRNPLRKIHADPLGYYLNNTCKSRSLLACAVEMKVPHFVFSSTAAVYGMPEENLVGEPGRIKSVGKSDTPSGGNSYLIDLAVFFLLVHILLQT